jgi:hypothetical protein
MGIHVVEQTQSLPSKTVSAILALLFWRVVAMLAVFLTIPLTIELMSSFYRRDGQQQFGLMVMSWIGGVFAACVYLVIATVAYFLLRKR